MAIDQTSEIDLQQFLLDQGFPPEQLVSAAENLSVMMTKFQDWNAAQPGPIYETEDPALTAARFVASNSGAESAPVPEPGFLEPIDFVEPRRDETTELDLGRPLVISSPQTFDELDGRQDEDQPAEHIEPFSWEMNPTEIVTESDPDALSILEPGVRDHRGDIPSSPVPNCVTDDGEAVSYHLSPSLTAENDGPDRSKRSASDHVPASSHELLPEVVVAETDPDQMLSLQRSRLVGQTYEWPDQQVQPAAEQDEFEVDGEFDQERYDTFIRKHQIDEQIAFEEEMQQLRSETPERLAIQGQFAVSQYRSAEFSRTRRKISELKRSNNIKSMTAFCLFLAALFATTEIESRPIEVLVIGVGAIALITAFSVFLASYLTVQMLEQSIKGIQRVSA